jgi:hypothetical protein
MRVSFETLRLETIPGFFYLDFWIRRNPWIRIRTNKTKHPSKSIWIGLVKLGRPWRNLAAE